MKLFKTKKQKIKEACQDIHVICNHSIGLIDNMQTNVSDMQTSVQELIRINQEMLKMYEDMGNKLDEVVGDSE